MKAQGKPVLGWGLGAPPVSGLAGWLAAACTRKSSCNLWMGSSLTASAGRRNTARLVFRRSGSLWRPTRLRHAQPIRCRTTEMNSRGSRASCLSGDCRNASASTTCCMPALPCQKPSKPELRIVGEGPARARLERLAQEIYPQAQFPGAHYGS